MDSKKRSNKQRIDQDDEEENQEAMNIEPIQYDTRLNQKDMMEEDGEQWEDAGEVNVDFVFLDPNENQQSSVKMLINGYLDGLSFRSTELAELIVKQAELGTMVGTEDNDEDEPEYKKQYREQSVYGFVTIFNIQLNKNKPVMKEILGYIVDKSSSFNYDKHQQLLQLLSGKSGRVGLLINERVVNLVPQVIPVLHNQLAQDLDWIQKEDPDSGFTFDYLLVMTETYKEQQTSVKQKVFLQRQLNSIKKVKQQGSLALDSLIYKKFEDYIFLQQCEFYFSYEAFSAKSQGGITNQQEKDYNEEVCNKIIYVIKLQNYLNGISKIESQIC